jgi:hypothetical protein
MEHIREFEFFSLGRLSSNPSSNKLRVFLSENNGRINDIFHFLGEGLKVDVIEAQTDILFTVSYDPPHDELPKGITYLMEAINEKLKLLINDKSLEWRFGVDDPLTIRFILSQPLK